LFNDHNVHNRISGVMVSLLALSALDSGWREQVNFQWDDEVHFVLDQHTELDFYSASSLKQQSADKHVPPLRHIIQVTTTHS
jgi:hypothetical protein